MGKEHGGLIFISSFSFLEHGSVLVPFEVGDSVKSQKTVFCFEISCLERGFLFPPLPF